MRSRRSIERITAWGVAVVAVALALLLTREWAPEPPMNELPPASPPAPAAPTSAPVPSRPPEPPAPEPREDGAAAAAASGDLVGDDAHASPAAPDGSRRFVFDCGNGVVFMVRTVPGAATLFSPQALGTEAVTLPQVEVASGARYAEGNVSYSSRGGLASFEIRERLFADCTSNPGAAQTAEARRRSATLRAHGNEPPWLLEVSRARIELSAPSMRDIVFPYREPTVAGTRTTYRTFSGTEELNVVIERIPCNDTMTGERFETTVTVTFANQTFYGCGQAP